MTGPTDYDHARPDLINLTAEAETKFRESHAAFLKFLPDLARHLPYQAGTRGIVTTAGGLTFGQTISLVLLTRQTGSRLPIQVVLDSSAPWVDFICENEFPRLNATCLYIDDMWANLDPLDTSRFSRFQWKVVSLIASTFQHVLFLDADCAPVLSPDHIFEKGAEPFTSAGLITWPDYWAPSMSTLFYKIAGDIPVPPLTARTTSESGVMVFDKARHADTLLLAAYYNYNGPGRYYTLLSQHGIGEGDKETFLQAALVLDALREKGVYSGPTEWMKPGAGIKKGYWDVKTMPKSHGRVGKGKKWRGMFMQQMDPMEDYRAVMAAVNKAGAVEGGNTGNPGSAPEQPAVPADYLTNSTFLFTTGNLTISASPARFMFFHHNGVKPDFTRILDPNSGILGVDDGDRPIRMWGDPKWIVERTGRDIEKLWWASSIEVYCRPEMEAWWDGVCAEMRRVFGKVYE
ncbi:mannosyltransferase putative-domain-containing protein [Corynascus novoguineensis]|uniref:Mannosyltransferase putative-domain-containing protein n=1 Tax=Corynascus novoguineensis TaxID=1126955 RepID=A0AAN7HG48_9PEZI|nr:mannosyltransferase putative-domain-containing protein [Corynascus novoguineensis]